MKYLSGLEKTPSISTTSQVVLNMTDNEMIFYKDKLHMEYASYINKLPNDYVPKLKVTIKETQKNLNTATLFTKKYLDKIYGYFNINS
jgi:hypothetical protein